MVSYLYGRILSNRWLSTTRTPADTPTSNIDSDSCRGILLRQFRGTYVSQPVGLAPELLAAVQKLNVEVAFTMSTDITDLIFSLLAPDQTELVLGLGGSQYQILESLEEIAKSTSSKVKRFQYACFVRREKVLLLWHDNVERILVHAAEVERTLLTVVSSQMSPSNIRWCSIQLTIHLGMGFKNTKSASSSLHVAFDRSHVAGYISSRLDDQAALLPNP